MKRVVVGMSGGVDSSVAALLLQKQGYDVVGLFMKNWDDSNDEQCPAAEDYQDVARVCDRLGIPYYGVEFTKEYRDRVFEDMVNGYQQGITPNPDVLCNREIKFDLFLKKAMELGADYLATGHYARLDPDEDGKPRLMKAIDTNKDQSYFLHAVSHRQFEKVLFPLGDLTKPQIRQIALEHDLATHSKKDSTGICFIGERKFRAFLQQFIQSSEGPFMHLDGTEVGRHHGASFYTLGQRKGLGLGGEGPGWFVVAKDQNKNIVYVERGETHPALFADELTTTPVHWIAGNAPRGLIEQGEFSCQVKSRYRQADQKATLVAVGDGQKVQVRFDSPQRALTPGQYVVFYHDEICLGGAQILEVGASFHEQGKEIHPHESFAS